MLDAEEARARLDAVGDPDWHTKAGHRAAGLCGDLREVATAVLEREPVARSDAAEAAWLERFDGLAGRLDALDRPHLLELTTALHPALGATMARWWTDAVHQPYSVGWRRQAFRAPRHPELTRGTRMTALRRIVRAVGPYPGDAAWLAAWAPYVGFGRSVRAADRGAFSEVDAGPLLAAAIDEGGDPGRAVFDALLSIGRGDHPVGMMGRHVIVGLLRASRPDGWAFVERMLLAAQRQEGLRQSILEAADESRPEAFDGIVATILDHDLLRFPATLRAVGVWLGAPTDVERVPDARRLLEQLVLHRTDAPSRRAALAGGDRWETYAALCAQAMTDVTEAMAEAEAVLHRGLAAGAGARAAAVRFAAATQLPAGDTLAWRALDDEDLRVAWLAFGAARYSRPVDAPTDAFDRLQRLAARLPKEDRALDPTGIDDRPIAASRREVVDAMFQRRGTRSPADLLPWLGAMSPWARRRMVEVIASIGPSAAPELREAVLALLGDRSPSVRNAAVTAMGRLGVEPAGVPSLERLLTRRAGDLRRAVIGLLGTMPDAEVVASAERLWRGGAAQRDAACELLRLVQDPPAAADAARRFSSSELSSRQAEMLAEVAGRDGSASTYRDDPGLGLYDPGRRAPVPDAFGDPGRVPSPSATSARIVGALDDLAEMHRDTPLAFTGWVGSEEALLADARWLPSPFQAHVPPDDGEHAPGLVLADVFRPWWQSRPPDLSDGADDLDALRALTFLAATQPADLLFEELYEEQPWWGDLLRRWGGEGAGELRHAGVVTHVLSWLLVEQATVAAVDECLDVVAATVAAVPAEAMAALETEGDEDDGWDRDFRHLVPEHPWWQVLDGLFRRRPDLFGAEQIRRWFHLARWFDQPRAGVVRHPVDAAIVVKAFELGVATEHDIFDVLLQSGSRLLRTLTRHRRSDVLARHADVVVLADRLRRRILDIELDRGEMATCASPAALRLGSISGAAIVARLLSGLGRAGLVRGWIGGLDEARESVYSHLLGVSHPAGDDTPETLAAAASAAGVDERRLLELAVFAPQWAALVEGALGWPGLADAVWWFHAHTKDDGWAVGDEVSETWAALSAERTPLAGHDLLAGAVDVAWFHRSRAALGNARWKRVHAVAKLASGGNGHRRAQLFADGMSGELAEPALIERIRGKRHQDSVRALGLVPLPDDPDDRAATTLRRYGVLRKFERGSSKFGSQRQASEKAAVRIGIENLARTAGMGDPQRFVWAMEAAEGGDLAGGPVRVRESGVDVTLEVGDEGDPILRVARDGRALKAIPPHVKRNPAVAALVARRTALSRQAARVRASLEAAMVNQDGFTAGALADLDRHPVVAPLLQLVVFADERGRLVRRHDGRHVDVDGAVASAEGALRIAHPVDLLNAGAWIAWQEQLFAGGRRQPFKQVFRELYTLTDAERAAGPASHRYEGHQVQPRQAMALLGRRGWLADRESGEVARVFHAHGVVARLEFVDGFMTPAEVELPTVKALYFTAPGTWQPENIETVPPVVFSEAMRDVDLVVSVAHAGGVDPEASHSTVEMRAALVRETARVLTLDNVREVGSHVVIEGALGEYSVHLGSGVVHRRPGGALCIVPVDRQRRGRLFLPFADDDPKTAEVIAKVLLLARDREIRDPTVLSQLRS